MASDTDWTDDTIARLRALWDEGHATAEIGRRMGITKNAVVGKAHRLELTGRESPIRRGASAASPPRQRRTAKPSLPPLASALTRPVAALPAPTPALVVPPLPLPRRHGPSGQPCCWPLGEPGRPGFRFCGEGTAPGRPYCQEHTNVAYVRAPHSVARTAPLPAPSRGA